jgi:hypothetical protein
MISSLDMTFLKCCLYCISIIRWYQKSITEEYTIPEMVDEVRARKMVQTTDGSVFVAERPMYWNYSGTQGGSDVIGYIGD